MLNSNGAQLAALAAHKTLLLPVQAEAPQAAGAEAWLREFAQLLVKMATTIYVDSRSRASGSDSQFEIQLRESLTFENARLRVDKVRFTDSFFTTDLGRYVYFRDGSGGLNSFALPEQAFTGPRLAASLQSLTGRSCSYSDQTNALTMAQVSGQEFLDDTALRAFDASLFPAGATPTAPLSINQVLGPSHVNDDGNLVFSFVVMNPYQNVFLRSRRLTCEGVHGPDGTHDILCVIPLDQGVGRTVVSGSPDNVYYELSGSTTLRHIDFSLTDFRGNVVNLRGRSLSFQLVFD